MRLTKQARDELRAMLKSAQEWAYSDEGVTIRIDQLDALIADSEELDRVLPILQKCGLNVKTYDTAEKAAVGVSEIVAALRRALADPTPDVQELVLSRLGIREHVARLAEERDAWRADAERLAKIVSRDFGSIACVCPTELGCRSCQMRQALESHNQLKEPHAD